MHLIYISELGGTTVYKPASLTMYYMTHEQQYDKKAMRPAFNISNQLHTFC